MLSEGLNPIKKILDDTFCGGRIVLSDEVKKLGDPALSKLGPQNAVRHLFVTAQQASANFFMGNHSSGLDIRQPPVNVPEEFDLFE